MGSMATDSAAGETLRRRRHAAALSQRRLAELSGIPQPNIAAYETGRRLPSPETVNRLDRVLAIPTLASVRAHNQALVAAARRGMVENIRVFGSVARGDSTADSDVDLLVHPLAGASLIEIASFRSEVAELLGRDVDVVSDRSDSAVIERILTEAVPL